MKHLRPSEHRRQPASMPRARTFVRGFSLLEVLISIIILSFGLLGMVGLQATALQSNREAKAQSVGISLARELAEMMRSNKDIALLTTGNPYLGDFATAPLKIAAPSYCLNTSNTSPACTTTTDIASAQMTEWLTRVESQLPGARVRVCIDSAPFVTSTGLPQWTCNNTAGAATVIKIGWTQGSTNRALTGSSAIERASDTGSRPVIVMPLTSGSTV
nr:type IV pilus modification protein PilV [uncultured Albidiferax sp.]